MTSMSIIGGADGPTSIYLKSSALGVILYFALVAAFIILPVIVIIERKRLRLWAKIALLVVDLIIFFSVFILTFFVVGIRHTSTSEKSAQLSTADIVEQIKNVPVMYIEFGASLDTPRLMKAVDSIYPAASTWYYFNGNNVESIVASGQHPLDSMNSMSKIKRNYGTKEIRISFDYMPTDYTVQYWPEYFNLMSHTPEKGRPGEAMEITNSTILLTPLYDEIGWIFEVSAVWDKVNGTPERGTAKYAFYVSGVYEKE